MEIRVKGLQFTKATKNTNVYKVVSGEPTAVSQVYINKDHLPMVAPKEIDLVISFKDSAGKE